MKVVRKFLSVKAAVVSLALLLLLSCGSSNRKYLIPKKKFINFLVDMHISEAIAGGMVRNESQINFTIDSASLYGSVFNKHHVTKAMFDSTMLYYSRRPEEFRDLYNSVTAILKTREEEISELLREQEKSNEIIIYKDDREYEFPPLEGYKIPVNVEITGPGVYIVRSRVKMFSQESALYPRMSVYYYQDNGTEEGARIPFKEIRYTLKNGQFKDYETTLPLESSGYTHIRGFILNYTNTDSLFPRASVVTEITVSRKK